MSFSSDIRRGAESLKSDIDRRFKGAAIACFKGIILDTPVDLGRLRANWFISGAEYSNESTENTDKTGSKAISGMAGYVTSNQSEVYSLTNNLPYAEIIEFGGNGRAPHAMVRTNLKRTADNMR